MARLRPSLTDYSDAASALLPGAVKAIIRLQAILTARVNVVIPYPAAAANAQVDDDSLPTRRSLLSRLRNLSDDASWRVFFETYWRLIYNVARKSGLSDTEAQEVVQETVIAVARRMPEFHYDPAKGSFKHWLLLITRRRIHDHLRQLYRSRRQGDVSLEQLGGGGEDLPTPNAPPDAQLDAMWEDQWRDHLYQTAIARVKKQANPKQYQVFHYCILQRWPAGKVARLLGLNAAQVYLAKHRIGQSIKRAVRELEAELERPAAA